GGQCIFTRHTIESKDLDEWSAIYRVSMRERGEALASHLAPGQHGHELHPALDLAESDIIINKHRYSALIEGSSDSIKILRRFDIETVIICGVLTNMCCECTARDAAMLNFQVIMPHDANAAMSDEAHN